MSEIVILRLVHVLGGIFWVGAGLFSALYFTPAMSAAGSAAGPIMAVMQRRHLFLVMPTVAVLTILAGLRLMWIMSGGLTAAYFATPVGATYAAGGAAAIIAFFISLLVTRPAMLSAGRLRSSLSSAGNDGDRARIEAQIARLGRRGEVAGRIGVWLLVFSAVTMAIGRYAGGLVS